jgi:hypothetical protein
MEIKRTPGRPSVDQGKVAAVWALFDELGKKTAVAKDQRCPVSLGTAYKILNGNRPKAKAQEPTND